MNFSWLKDECNVLLLFQFLQKLFLSIAVEGRFQINLGSSEMDEGFQSASEYEMVTNPVGLETEEGP